MKVGEDTFIHPAVAPALMMVGYLMMRIVADIDWDAPESAIPAFLIIAGIPLTFSISAGIGLGVIGYVLVMATTGKARQVHPLDVGHHPVLRGLLRGRLARGATCSEHPRRRA